MKKILFIILAGLGTWGTLAWVSHSGWKVVGLVIGGILALAIVAVLFKAIIRFIKWAFTSCVYLTLVTATLSLLTAYSIIPMVWGMPLSILFSWLLAVMVIRSIGYKAQTSVIWGEIFGWLTGFKTVKVSKNKEVKLQEDNSEEEREDIISGLKGLGYSNKDCSEAADYVEEEKPEATQEEKMVLAIQYLGKTVNSKSKR